MKFIPQILKSICTATCANLIGRAANIAIALSVIAFCGADTQTDRFFFIMIIAFYFFGPVSNAITTAAAPLIISGKLNLTPAIICLAGVSITAVIWMLVFFYSALIAHLPPIYILAVGLMSGAGIANGFCAGTHYAAESFFLPGFTWSLRLIPLAFFGAIGFQAKKLAWLAMGIGLADWFRLAILVRGPGPTTIRSSPYGLKTLVAAFPSFGKVITASVIMGLNPIIDRIIARLSGAGAVSVLEAGERTYMMLASVSTIGLTTVLLSRLSTEAASDELEINWPRTIRLTAIWNGFWILAGAAVGYWGLGWWLHTSTALTAVNARAAQWVYWCYLAGLPAFAFGVVYEKRLQALQRWWVMVGTSTLALVINIPASLMLRKWMGVPGIALATTLIYSMNLIVLKLAVHRHENGSLFPVR